MDLDSQAKGFLTLLEPDADSTPSFSGFKAFLLELLDLDLVILLEPDADSAPLGSGFDAFLLTLLDLDREAGGFVIFLESDVGLETSSETLDFFLSPLLDRDGVGFLLLLM